MITLVTGGARSGKSDFAEKLVKEAAGDAPVLYIATATNTDGEMDDLMIFSAALTEDEVRELGEWYDRAFSASEVWNVEEEE